MVTAADGVDYCLSQISHWIYFKSSEATVIMNVEHEIKLLVQELKRLGSPNADGNISVKFGVLFADDRCANIFEGT